MKVIFLGTPGLAVPSLEAVHKKHEIVLVVTQPDRPRGRGRRLASSAVKGRAMELGLALWQPDGLGDDASTEPLASAGADIMAVVAYGLKLPDPVLALTAEGAVNLHFSLLPAYRGAAPINWAIIRGEEETGLTTFRLTSRMDGGPLLSQKPVAIGGEETAGELAGRLAEAGAGLLVETLAGIEGGTLAACPQKEDGASLAPKLRKTDGEIDWSRPAGQIVNLVRGVNPWPGAFSRLEKRTIKIWRAETCAPPEGTPPEPPGTILRASPRQGLLVVAAGEGALCLREIQGEGRRRMSAGDFLAGHRLRAGLRFS